jgi:hypothetical protein
MAEIIERFNFPRVQGVITRENYVFTIEGQTDIEHDSFVTYTASAPPDIRMSRIGSGLPFPNERTAYENSPNSGQALIRAGQFRFSVVYPNSYYQKNGSELVRPHVIFVINNEYHDVGLGHHYVKHKSLTSLPDKTLLHTRATGR